jgi:hypothetical protein
MTVIKNLGRHSASPCSRRTAPPTKPLSIDSPAAQFVALEHPRSKGSSPGDARRCAVSIKHAPDADGPPVCRCGRNPSRPPPCRSSQPVPPLSPIRGVKAPWSSPPPPEAPRDRVEAPPPGHVVVLLPEVVTCPQSALAAGLLLPSSPAAAVHLQRGEHLPRPIIFPPASSP